LKKGLLYLKYVRNGIICPIGLPIEMAKKENTACKIILLSINYCQCLLLQSLYNVS